jgi:septum formation topological specificity factor MinE
MTFFNPFQRRASAPVARERRQILLSERAARGQSAKRDWAVS